MALPGGLLLTPADSARAVGDVYGVSLLATVPLLAAAIAFVVLRRASAGTRMLIWRSTTVAVLAVWLGRFLPWHWMAWVVPEGLASPLVALGRVQLAVAGSFPVGAGSRGLGVVDVVLAAYWVGVAAVLLPTVVARWRLVRLSRSWVTLSHESWSALLEQSRLEAGVRGRVRLVMSPAVRTPMTWGTVRPIIVMPRAAAGWSFAQRRAALLHELTHVRRADAFFGTVLRVICAFFWFHPGMWWLASRFATDAELACDDRVLFAGVRRSDYAELLLTVLEAHRRPGLTVAVALVRQDGMRSRLAAIVDPMHPLRLPSRHAVIGTVLLTFAVAIPAATVRVAPTRDVLTTLMQDTRWESRAYAVLRLAQRRDSVEVARNAARHDPSPRVRAWAQYALARENQSPAPAAPVSHE